MDDNCNVVVGNVLFTNNVTVKLATLVVLVTKS